MTPKHQVMPELTAQEFTELKNSISMNGVLVAVEYDENGEILDGHHRVQACEELGIKDWPKIVKVGMSEQQKRDYARTVNVNRRHLNQDQRGELIRQQLIETPEKSDRQIAMIIGVDHKTVGVIREKLESHGEIPHVSKVTDTLGRERPRQIERKPITIFEPTEEKIEDAKEVIKDAIPEIVQAVADNKIPLMVAHAVASKTTLDEQTEAFKRLEDGKTSFLMEGINQQRFEKEYNMTAQEREAMNERIKTGERQIDYQYAWAKKLNKFTWEFSSLEMDNIQEGVQCWLEVAQEGLGDIDGFNYRINQCISNLQIIKTELSKARRFKVVK